MTHQATRQAAINYLADAIGVLAGDPANEPTMRVLAGILAALIERGESPPGAGGHHQSNAKSSAARSADTFSPESGS
jgi:hypothetical protein